MTKHEALDILSTANSGVGLEDALELYDVPSSAMSFLEAPVETKAVVKMSTKRDNKTRRFNRRVHQAANTFRSYFKTTIQNVNAKLDRWAYREYTRQYRAGQDVINRICNGLGLTTQSQSQIARAASADQTAHRFGLHRGLYPAG